MLHILFISDKKVSVNGQSKMLISAFSYNANVGPIVTAVHPNITLSGIKSSEITIHGQRFSSGSQPQIKVIGIADLNHFLLKC